MAFFVLGLVVGTLAVFCAVWWRRAVWRRGDGDRCGNRLTGFGWVRCELSAGHEGDHRAIVAHAWSRETVQPSQPAQDESRSAVLISVPPPSADDLRGRNRCEDRSPLTTMRCLLPSGHAGPHDANDGNPWPMPKWDVAVDGRVTIDGREVETTPSKKGKE